MMCGFPISVFARVYTLDAGLVTPHIHVSPKFADGGAGAKLEVSNRGLCKLNWRRGVWKFDTVSFRKSRISKKEGLLNCLLLLV